MYGTFQVTAEVYRLRFERHFAHPVEKVWGALTQPDQLIAWLAEAEVDLTQGGRMQLRWLNSHDYGSYTVARGTVITVNPPRLVEYDTDMHGRLRWELAPAEGGCLLTFTCIASFSWEELARCLAGWHIHLDHLEQALQGNPVDWPRWKADHWVRWTEYHDHYAASVGASS